MHEALAAQPDLLAALLDAGEYAACRDDAQAADGYLRQSGHPLAGALREALRRQLPPPKTTTGRNQPCPCGSGRRTPREAARAIGGDVLEATPVRLPWYIYYTRREHIGVEFEFDPGKSEANQQKHGIDFAEAQALWQDPMSVEIPARTVDEPRWLVIGQIGGKHWSAVITYRQQTVRIISVRRSRDEEVAIYES